MTSVPPPTIPSDQPVRLVIVGGGTAGWLTAVFLLRQLPLTCGREARVTLIEASDIPTIGVGEATVPSLRQTLAACGLGERAFMKAAEATFKHGISFRDWHHIGHSYFHPFGDVLSVPGANAVQAWTQSPVTVRPPFADAFSVQSEMAQTGRAPKQLNDRDYDGALAYAYHLDAGKLANYLKETGRERGVEHIIGTIAHVTRSGNGIHALTLESGQQISGDLFIDCTGFARTLIDPDQQQQFLDVSDTLFVDRAVTTRIDTLAEVTPNAFTTSMAQAAGWIWDIGLRTRRGIGHVYSSRHTTDEDAANVLAGYVGQSAADIDIRRLSFRAGYLPRQWQDNCIAVGLSGGFLEPLESTGIYLIEMANWALAAYLPRYFSGVDVAPAYNQTITHHYRNIVDFLKLHYALSDRNDTAFWRENKNPNSWTPTLLAYLSAWATTPPCVYDFPRSIQCFSATNYQFVLYGMNWPGHLQPMHLSVDQQQGLSELALRRDRLKEFVLRDTVAHAAYLAAVDIAPVTGHSSAPHTHHPGGSFRTH